MLRKKINKNTIICANGMHGIIYSAFHLSGVGKWVPAIAGKAKAGMAHCSDCGWTCGCGGKTVKSLENTCHTLASLRWWFTTKRRYIKCMQHAPLPLPLWVWRSEQKVKGQSARKCPRAWARLHTGPLVAGVDVRRATAADQLLVISQTEHPVGRHPTGAALTDPVQRATHAFRARRRRGRVARVSTVPRCLRTSYTQQIRQRPEGQ